MNVIIDIQGFKSENNEFIPKEIAILCKQSLLVLSIKPPCAFYNLTKKERVQVSWIERNRGIYWNEGLVPYINYKYYIINFLKDKCIYTKGYEKVLWLKDILDNDNVYNLEDKNCPNFDTLYKRYSTSSDIQNCINHSKMCALKNVCCLNKWCKETNALK